MFWMCVCVFFCISGEVINLCLECNECGVPTKSPSIAPTGLMPTVNPTYAPTSK